MAAIRFPPASWAGPCQAALTCRLLLQESLASKFAKKVDAQARSETSTCGSSSQTPAVTIPDLDARISRPDGTQPIQAPESMAPRAPSFLACQVGRQRIRPAKD